MRKEKKKKQKKGGNKKKLSSFLTNQVRNFQPGREKSHNEMRIEDGIIRIMC